MPDIEKKTTLPASGVIMLTYIIFLSSCNEMRILMSSTSYDIIVLQI